MRLLAKSLVLLLAAVGILGGALLAWAHIQIRRIAPELPLARRVVEPERSPELPVRLSWINTASQRMPRAAVLDPSRDPHPEAAYVMSHPAFVIEWQDGRIFLVDLGMDTESAVDFGVPLEMLAGASPIEPHGSASEALGEDRSRIAGLGFTHLHADHTAGLARLCADLGTRAPGGRPVLFQHENQITVANHTTWGPRSAVRSATCVTPRSLGHESGMLAVPGFPGLHAVPVGGHTPGSTMWVVHLRAGPGERSQGLQTEVQTWVITGDVVNHVQGIELGLSKPGLYSWLVVPEDDERLGEVRGFLEQLSREPGVHLLVNHDRSQIEATGLRVY